MLPEEWPRARSVLTEALKVPTGERTRFIEDAFPNNPRMWDELLGILDGYDKATHSEELEWSEDPELNKLLPTIAPSSAPGSTPASGNTTTTVLTIGEQYGSYRVLRELTPGGMGQVFLAEDVRMPRRVVLKCLSGKWIASEAAQQRFRREANSACVLNHGNVATLYDVVEDRGQFLLVFEYVEGRTLRRVLGEGPVPLGLSLRLAIQLTDAIKYAHDQGIFHCDIKPENIQVTHDNRIKVLDFGLARARYDTGRTVSEADRGKLLGTAGYMAPERLARGTLNASGDIYCIGVVLFELLTGRHPYPERGASQVLSVLGTDAPRPSSLVGGISAELDMISERALARDPTLRYQSARELSRDLNRVVALIDRGVEEPQPPRPLPRPVWLSAAGALACVFGLFTFAGSVTSTAFNVALGRTGEFGESVLLWPVWGIRSLIAPFVLIAAYVILIALPFIVAGLVLKIGAIRRSCAPLLERGRSMRASFIRLPASTIAQAMLVVQVLVLIGFWWRFNRLLESLFSFTSQSATMSQLARMGPWIAGQPDDRAFRQNLSLVFAVFLIGSVLLVRRAARHRDEGSMPSLVAVVAVTVFTLGLLSLPFRILRQNISERVSYNGERCYIVGQRGDDGLLFCPLQPPPWRRIVRLDDPSLKREQTHGNIFEELEKYTEVSP